MLSKKFLTPLVFIVSMTTAQAEIQTDAHQMPFELTEAQLDSVTAGAIALDVEAVALAISADGAFTYTNADTEINARGDGVLEVGYASGEAYACCGPLTFADVSISASADGEIVIVRTEGTQIRTPNSAYESESLVIISINPSARVSSRRSAPRAFRGDSDMDEMAGHYR